MYNNFLNAMLDTGIVSVKFLLDIVKPLYKTKMILHHQSITAQYIVKLPWGFETYANEVDLITENHAGFRKKLFYNKSRSFGLFF